MSLGRSRRQRQLFDEVSEYCASALGESSIYTFLHRDRDRLFPDDLFADLFSYRGRRSIPPSVVAVVMVLQRLEGLSDYEAAERFSFDARWRFAAGVGGYGEERLQGFDRSVLVQMRERLRCSSDPDRIFRIVLEAGKEAGLVGHKRVLDSSALYDSVATMDTITLIRSAIRGVLKVLSTELEQRVRKAFVSDDSYDSSAKPSIDWEDSAARDELINSRARDGYACLGCLEGELLSDEQRQAVELLATILGQDLEIDEDGRYRILRGVARDRVISTVDPEARHGHKTSSRGFDGYKIHIAVDPESELITACTVTAGNVADGSVAEVLIEDLAQEQDECSSDEKPEVYGDGSYGTASFQQELEDRGIDSYCKTPRATARSGFFTKDDFEIDLEAKQVRCPAGCVTAICRVSRPVHPGELRERLSGLSSARAVHLGEEPVDPNQQGRSDPAASPSKPKRPSLERELQPSPTYRRAQVRPLYEAQARRPKNQDAGTRPSHGRLAAPCCRDQSKKAGKTRTAIPGHRLESRPQPRPKQQRSPPYPQFSATTHRELDP